MAEVLLFHHVQGLTLGVRELADRWRAGGHVVHTPDLFDGRTFDSIGEGFAAVQERGFDAVERWADGIVSELPSPLVYAGISLGVMSAQRLAQTRPGALGAILLEACLPIEEHSPTWPAGVPVQVHGMDADPFFADEGDLDEARALADEVPSAQVFTYPGQTHLFTDSALPDFDARATDRVVERVLEFLGRVDAAGVRLA